MVAINEVTSMDQFHALLEQSQGRPVLLLKHSTTCPISAAAHQQYEKFISNSNGNSIEVYLIKVIESRPVSLAIADEIKVKHESPQLLLFKDRKVAWSANHYDVTVSAIEMALAK
ncbi:MAG: bacillithiol system redox-active protein YtxJ [Bacilli bacterium]